jgi:hypothetical protein
MFEFSDRVGVALEKGDCELAISNALKSNNFGKLWLSKKIEYENESSGQIRFNRESLALISGTYINLYKSYSCKADVDFKSHRFSSALKNYQSAYTFLTSCNHPSGYWNEEIELYSAKIRLCRRSL